MSEPNYQGIAPRAIDVLDHGFVALRSIAGPNIAAALDWDE